MRGDKDEDREKDKEENEDENKEGGGIVMTTGSENWFWRWSHLVSRKSCPARGAEKEDGEEDLPIVDIQVKAKRRRRPMPSRPGWRPSAGGIA